MVLAGLRSISCEEKNYTVVPYSFVKGCHLSTHMTYVATLHMCVIIFTIVSSNQC